MIIPKEQTIMLIIKYGSEILESNEFKRSLYQRHHIHSTVGIHSVNVAVICLLIAESFERLALKLDERTLVQAALCHDLGLSDAVKFESSRECCVLHPEISARIAKERFHTNDICIQAIRTHMWPMSNEAPTSPEGYILEISDKIAAILEFCHIRIYCCRHIAPSKYGTICLVQ